MSEDATGPATDQLPNDNVKVSVDAEGEVRTSALTPAMATLSEGASPLTRRELVRFFRQPSRAFSRTAKDGWKSGLQRSRS